MKPKLKRPTLLAAAHGSASPLQWCKSRPSEPGYYFWRYSSRAGSGVVRVCHLNGGLWVDGDSLGTGMVDKWPGQWAGPIVPPVSPNEKAQAQPPTATPERKGDNQ